MQTLHSTINVKNNHSIELKSKKKKKWKLEQKIRSFHQDENNCFFDIAIDIITLLPYEEEANIGE